MTALPPLRRSDHRPGHSRADDSWAAAMRIRAAQRRALVVGLLREYTGRAQPALVLLAIRAVDDAPADAPVSGAQLAAAWTQARRIVDRQIGAAAGPGGRSGQWPDPDSRSAGTGPGSREVA